MMSRLTIYCKILVLLSLGIDLVLSRTFYSSNFYDADRKCYDEKSKRELFIGENFQRAGQCIRVQCLGDLSLWEDKCNDPQIQGNCFQEYLNLDQPYPICCPLHKCEYNYGATKEFKVYDHQGTLLSRSVTHLLMIDDKKLDDISRRIKVTM